MKTQFLIDENGKKQGVVLSLKEYKLYKAMLDKLEMEEDVKAYDKAVAEFERNRKCYSWHDVKQGLYG